MIFLLVWVVFVILLYSGYASKTDQHIALDYDISEAESTYDP